MRQCGVRTGDALKPGETDHHQHADEAAIEHDFAGGKRFRPNLTHTPMAANSRQETSIQREGMAVTLQCSDTAAH